jgi:hypothetical protein
MFLFVGRHIRKTGPTNEEYWTYHLPGCMRDALLPGPLRPWRFLTGPSVLDSPSLVLGAALNLL